MPTSQRARVSSGNSDALTEADNRAGWELAELIVPEDSGELAADLLWSCGAGAVEERVETPGHVVLRGNVSRDHQSDLEHFARRHGGSFRWHSVPRDITDTWRVHAVPTRVTGDVWLVPAWVEAPEGRAVQVEPFDTFGLGNHPTTVLALRLALAHGVDGTRVLDVGCGSGVLAVALALLMDCTSDGTDIALQAERALAHNSVLNGVGDRVRWRGPLGAQDDGVYGMVVANILAPVLRELADDIVRACGAGGRIILSGMRADQVADVVSWYAGWSVIDRDELDGWAAAVLEKARP